MNAKVYGAKFGIRSSYEQFRENSWRILQQEQYLKINIIWKSED